MASKFVLSLIILITCDSAFAGSAHWSSFLNTYPQWYRMEFPTTGPMKQCLVCHHPRQDQHNPYGQDFFETSIDGQHSFKAIEHLDSDGDGFTNIEEINALTFPGDPQSYPEASEYTQKFLK